VELTPFSGELKMSEKRKNVKAETFVKAILEYEDLADVAVILDLTLDSVYQRYATYRRNGVKLPDRPRHKDARRGSKGLDLDALNALIAGGETPETPEPAEIPEAE
jgi:hypothetical protein